MSEIVLGGQARRLSYPFASLKRLKMERGVNLLKMQELDFLDPVTMSALLWGGLIAETPSVTEAEVDGWFAMEQFAAITTAIADAIVEGQGGTPAVPLTTGVSSPAPSATPPTV